MKHLQSFNESIVEDKMQYLRDICNDFFDDYEGFEFEVINGRRDHQYNSMIDEFDIRYSNDTHKYIFLCLKFKSSGLIRWSYEEMGENLSQPILNKFNKYLKSVGFLYNGVTAYLRDGLNIRLYRFEKHSKRTEKYF